MTTIENHPTHADSSLEQRVAELEAANARLMAKLEASIPSTDTTGVPEPTGNRRNLFKLAAGAAAGGTALALTKSAGPVAAGDNDPILAGAETTAGDLGPNETVLRYTNANGPTVPGAILLTTNPASLFTVRDEPTGPFLFGSASSSDYPAAVGGKAYNTVANGVYGFSLNGGAGVVGQGGTDELGMIARGGRANIELYAAGDAPTARTDAHTAGEMIADSAGDLWFCTVAGTPGTWVKLTEPVPTIANYSPVTPFRVYDSRQESGGAFTGGETRTISVAASKNVETYAEIDADAVPAGATAVTGNVVAIATTDSGFIAINPGGTTAISAASVNYVAGQIIGNAGTFALNGSRELEAVFGPGNGCHMTIDITGYYV